MNNPIDFMIAKTGMSRAEVTAKYSLGKNLLIRASQGRVQSITPKIESVLWKEWKERGIDQDLFDEEYGTLSLNHAFQVWRAQERASRRGDVPVQVENDTKIPPFARLVKAVGSISKTAKLLMVADLPVQSYTRGTTAGMPEPIKEALDELGYPHTKGLAQAQKIWQEKH